MASFWNLFTRTPSKPSTPTQPSPTGPQSPASALSPSSPVDSAAPQIPASVTASGARFNMADGSQPTYSRKTPHFFREETSGLIVKGNFMTLAAKPEAIESGEWLAHQVVEQYRLLEGMIKVIQETDSRTHQPICNPQTCPTMSAAEFTYTWLDNYRNPIRIPACQYITLVQKWIMGKINDPRIFSVFDVSELSKYRQNQAPQNWVGKDSGFPESFESDIKSLYRQMFRCYAHIYHGHWLDPFYHLGAYKELNTCFIHFVNVGKLFGLLEDRDMKPMQPLVDIWVAKGLLPVAQLRPAVAAPQVAATNPAAQGPAPAAPVTAASPVA